MSLKTGEGLIFAPAGVGLRSASSQTLLGSDFQEQGLLSPFGEGHLLVRSRHRITSDGGKSILATTGSSEVQEPLNPPQLTQNRPHLGSPAVNGTVRVPLPTPVSSPAAVPSNLRAPQANDNESRPLGLPPSKTHNHINIPVPGNTYRPPLLPPTKPPILNPTPGPSVAPRFLPLIRYLLLHGKTSWVTIGEQLQKERPAPYSVGHLRVYLQAAVGAKLVTIGGSGSALWVDIA